MSPSEEFRSIVQSIPADFSDPAADYRAVREMFAPFHGHPVGNDLEIQLTRYGGVPCGVYELKGFNHARTAFHCHGGGLVSCPLDVYHFYAELIVRCTGCRVVMPDYRLAPEYPYPAAQEDCFDAYGGLLDSGEDPSGIAVMGESCGGILAMALLRRARDEGLALPACFVSLTGWFDLAVRGERVPGHDPFLTPEWVRNRGRDYLAGQLELDDPGVSPAYADLQGLPPMYLQIGQFDCVREGALTLAANAIRAGVAVTVESWPGMVQGWHGLAPAGVPEAAAAWAAISAFVERHCAAGNPASRPVAP